MDTDTGELFLGLMSGTSADAIDAVLACFDGQTQILASRAHPWPEPLRQRIVALARNDATMALAEFGELDALIGSCLADAAVHLLLQAGVEHDRVRAIGSHGQTVCHRPNACPPFTLQLGNPSIIAERTGIDVVADFRAADIAAGGQGAPLLPIFHAATFGHANEVRVVLNLGGIANITVLAPGAPVLGFDTGPANCLMDAWALRHLGQSLDEGGAWARTGQLDEELLARCLADPYFALLPPKSTGREHFNIDWLDARIEPGLKPEDVQATLLAVTAKTVVDAIQCHAVNAHRVIVCGGGVHNPALMASLDKALQPAQLQSSAELDVDPDFLEATAFAWLARQRLAGLPGNLPSVTGAHGPRVLGVIAAAPRT